MSSTARMPRRAAATEKSNLEAARKKAVEEEAQKREEAKRLYEEKLENARLASEEALENTKRANEEQLENARRANEEQLETESRELEEKLSKANREAKESLEAVEAERSARIRELEAAVAKQGETIAALETELAAGKQKIDEQEKEIHRLSVYVPFKAETERLRAEGHDKDQHNEEIEDQLRESRILLEQSERRVQRLSSIIEQQKHKIEDYDAILENGSVEMAETRAKRILAEANEKSQATLKEAENIRERILAAAKATYYNTLQFKMSICEHFSELEREIDESANNMRQIEMPSIPLEMIEVGDAE